MLAIVRSAIILSFYLPVSRSFGKRHRLQKGEIRQGCRRQRRCICIMEPEIRLAEWSGDFGIEGFADVTSLAPASHGLVYALIGRGDHVISAGAPEIRPRLALIDPNRRKLITSAWLPEDYGPLSWHGSYSLKVGPDGSVYGARLLHIPNRSGYLRCRTYLADG